MVRPAIRIEAGTATIFTGCNSGTASVQFGGRTVQFGEFRPTTRRRCQGYVGRIDRIVRGTLRGPVFVGVEGAHGAIFQRRSGFGLMLSDRPIAPSSSASRRR